MRVGDFGEKEDMMSYGWEVFIKLAWQVVGWFSASDASGVTASAAHPCLCTPDSDFSFWSSLLQEIGEGSLGGIRGQ